MPKLLENTNLPSTKIIAFTTLDSAWYVIEVSAKVKNVSNWENKDG